jgi:hypothetical protein
MLKTKARLAFALTMALTAAGTIAAQSPTDPPSAPLPSQISAAKKIFISNASGETLSGAQASELTYNGFYAGVNAWGRYNISSAPADADLIFEIRYETPLGPINVFQGSGASSTLPQIHLAIIDPKTHVVLWAFSELMVSTKHESDRQHLDETMSNLVNDLKKLVLQIPQNVATVAR